MKFKFFVVGNQWMFVIKDDETVEEDWELEAYYNEWQERWEVKIRKKVWFKKGNWYLVEEKEVKVEPERLFDVIARLYREEVSNDGEESSSSRSSS